MAETADVEVEVGLYEENVGTPYSTSDEMDNFVPSECKFHSTNPHTIVDKKLHLLQKCSGPFRNTLRSLAGDVNCEMLIEAGPDSAHLHSDKDHQILFVGGPNTRKTNPRWRTAPS